MHVQLQEAKTVLSVTAVAHDQIAQELAIAQSDITQHLAEMTNLQSKLAAAEGKPTLRASLLVYNGMLSCPIYGEQAYIPR